jgi:hypothetical protein
MPWEESQLITSTFLLLTLGVHSKRTLWYTALPITVMELSGKQGINPFCSHLSYIYIFNCSLFICSHNYFCCCKLYLHCIHLCSVSFMACVVLCAVFCLSVMCVICVLRLIVVSVPPGKNPFAV